MQRMKGDSLADGKLQANLLQTIQISNHAGKKAPPEVSNQLEKQINNTMQVAKTLSNQNSTIARANSVEQMGGLSSSTVSVAGMKQVGLKRNTILGHSNAQLVRKLSRGQAQSNAFPNVFNNSYDGRSHSTDTIPVGDVKSQQ
jgi:hypothetical protein